ncbi:hypothetical protein M378DRAFT_478855 [Amanita muscaria Koide BX008]|uniref:Uncharacterized protein n=1 Tax=Amanita muscaria (strain Koide BX008) TaxID=946122 RepID=A0A0C2T478_AMAMK|nr:hypothetical protein M378DRAFT_478855 [Amanita muscaria Koide BX008]
MTRPHSLSRRSALVWMANSGRAAMIESTVNNPLTSSANSAEPAEQDVEARSATRLSKVDTVPRMIQSSDFLCQQIARKLSVILVRVKSFSIVFPRDSLSRPKPSTFLTYGRGINYIPFCLRYNCCFL